MSSIDLIQMGLKNLWRRKLRTFLTVLGVVIGTNSIVVMLSLGFGMQEAFKGLIEGIGSLNTINVHKNPGESSLVGQSRDVKLNDKTIMKFKTIPHVTAVTPIVETYGLIKTGRYVAHASIRGIDPEAIEYFDFKIAEGRLLQPGDKLHVIFGGGMKYNFLDEKAMQRDQYKKGDVDIMNDRMTLTFNMDMGASSNMFEDSTKQTKYKDYSIKPVGVLEEGNWETDYSVYAPIEIVKEMIEENKKMAPKTEKQNRRTQQEYEKIMIKVDDIKNVESVQQKIKNDGFEAYSLNDQLKEMNTMTGIIQAVLGGIGAISLLVAAIGITNTMVMSIYERTKEIGVMKVIGASLGDIKKLFLLESAMIGLLGGIVGIIFSYILSFLINKFSPAFGNFIGVEGEAKISIIPMWLVFAALGFSAFIGIVSGYYPARRAMNLSALEAIKTE